MEICYSFLFISHLFLIFSLPFGLVYLFATQENSSSTVSTVVPIITEKIHQITQLWTNKSFTWLMLIFCIFFFFFSMSDYLQLPQHTKSLSSTNNRKIVKRKFFCTVPNDSVFFVIIICSQKDNFKVNTCWWKPNYQENVWKVYIFTTGFLKYPSVWYY